MAGKHDSCVVSTSASCATGGAVINDTCVLELVRGTNSRLQVLHWDGIASTISETVRVADRTYRALDLDPAVLQSLPLPTHAAEYGSLGDLIGEIRESLNCYNSVSESTSWLLAYACISTWFSDCLPLAPSFSIASLRTSDAILLLRHLRAFCRQGLLLGELPPAALRLSLRGLPVSFLVHEAEITPATEEWLNLVSHHDVMIAQRESVVAAYGPVFIASRLHPPHLDNAIKISLLPRNGRQQYLDPGSQQDIAQNFQPKLLMYRLRNHAAVRASTFDLAGFASSTRDTARALGMCITELLLQHQVGELLADQDERARSERALDVRSIVVEALIFHCHAPQQEFILIKEITEAANFILRERNETRELSSKAVGSMLDSLGLPARIRRGSGYRLNLDEGTRRVIHRIARGLGVRSLQDGVELCRHCGEDEGEIMAA
jgi:hypothetical protein